MSSTVMTNIENVRDKKIKNKESRDLWWKALESKTHMEKDIPEELMVSKLEGVYIACGYVMKNFLNYSLREVIVGLKDNVGPNPYKSNERTTTTILDYGDM